jgi:hypothetical protein
MVPHVIEKFNKFVLKTTVPFVRGRSHFRSDGWEEWYWDDDCCLDCRTIVVLWIRFWRMGLILPPCLSQNLINFRVVNFLFNIEWDDIFLGLFARPMLKIKHPELIIAPHYYTKILNPNKSLCVFLKASLLLNKLIPSIWLLNYL